MPALKKSLTISLLATLLFQSCTTMLSRGAFLDDKELCEDPAGCTCNLGEHPPECAEKEYCVQKDDNAFCLAATTEVKVDEVCKENFCPCGVVQGGDIEGGGSEVPQFSTLCSKDQKCFKKIGMYYCAREEKKVLEPCKSKLGCLVSHPKFPDSFPPAVCEENEMGLEMGNTVQCAHMEVAYGIKCDKPTCACKFESTLGLAGTTKVTTYTRITKDQICANKLSEAAGADKAVYQNEVCTSEFCYCMLGAAKVAPAATAVTDRQKFTICKRDQVCGSNQLQTYSICAQVKMSIDSKCEDPKGCICEGKFAAEGNVKAADYKAFVLSGDYCVKLVADGKAVAVGITPNEHSQPVFKEDAVCTAGRPDSACICEVSINSVSKRFLCGMNEICSYDLKTKLPLCRKASLMEGKQCDKAQCECSQTVGDNSASCKQTEFCVRRPTFSCVPAKVQSGEVCNSDKGCLCHDENYFEYLTHLSGGKRLSEAIVRRIRSYAVCNNGDTCMDDNQGTHMKCGKGDTIAVNGVAAKDSICKLETGKAVYCPAKSKCILKGTRAFCPVVELKDRKFCVDASCFCPSTNVANPPEVCLKDEQCITDQKAKCMPPTVSSGTYCRDGDCACYFKNEFSDDIPITLMCAKGQFCMKTDGGAECVVPVTDIAAFPKTATDKKGIACAFTDRYSVLSVSCHLGQTCRYSPTGGTFCADPKFEVPITTGDYCPNFASKGCRCNSANTCNAGYLCKADNSCQITDTFNYYVCPQGVYCYCFGATFRKGGNPREFCMLKGGFVRKAYLIADQSKIPQDYVQWTEEMRQKQILSLIKRGAYNNAVLQGKKNLRRRLAGPDDLDRQPKTSQHATLQAAFARTLLVRI